MVCDGVCVCLLACVYLASALRLEERMRYVAGVVDGETDGEDEVNDRDAIDSKAPHLHKAEKRKGVRGKGVVRGMCVGVVAMCVQVHMSLH